MLFMVTETFRNRGVKAVRERFSLRGRMLHDGVIYHASWMDMRRMRCFQVMEAADLPLLREWIRQWEDLVDFQVILVGIWAKFWSKDRESPMA